MLLQSQSIPDLYKVLRIIDDINEGDLYNEDDNASDEECEISLAVTPDHLNSDTETIDSINPVQSGSGITVAAATTSDVPGRSEISSDSDIGQQEGDTRPKTSGPEVGEARLLQDVVMTSLDPLLVGGMAVAGMWLGLQLVHPVEIVAAVVSSHQDKTLFHLVEMLAQRETKGEAW